MMVIEADNEEQQRARWGNIARIVEVVVGRGGGDGGDGRAVVGVGAVVGAYSAAAVAVGIVAAAITSYFVVQQAVLTHLGGAEVLVAVAR